MIVVTGTIRVDDPDIEKAKNAARAMVSETEKEAGCITYRFSEDISEPGLFRVYEEWETGDHLKAHGATEHMGVFRAALGKLNILSRDIKMFPAGEVKSL